MPGQPGSFLPCCKARGPTPGRHLHITLQAPEGQGPQSCALGLRHWLNAQGCELGHLRFCKLPALPGQPGSFQPCCKAWRLTP